jgi:GPH family glycoside/pentoside/hexuronide:cation symporter
MPTNLATGAASMQKKLTRRDKWMYGVGDVGFSLTGTIIAAYFAIFLTDVVGLAPAIAAAAIFIGRTSDYINDPIIGYISDRTRSRWGRRRPFLLFGAIPFALVYILLWWHPPLINPYALAVYYAVVYMAFDIAATFVYMPYFALTPELTSDYDERTSLSTTRMFFSILGSLLAFTLPLMIVKGFTPENAGRILLMGAVFGLASAIPLLMVFFGTKERLEFQEQKAPGILPSLRAALKNRPFVFGLGIYLFTAVSMDILQTILLFYIKYVVQREGQSDLIMAVIFVTAILVLPFWEFVSKKMNKRYAYIAGISFWAVVQLMLITLNPESPMALLIFLCVLAGIGVSAAHVLPWSILPDAIEWGEWKTGERHEGMFYSLITLAAKIASSIAIPVSLLVLDASGYVSSSAIQPPSAIAGIRMVTGPIPAVLLCMGILFAFLYPLGRENYSEIAKELEARRKAREDK